MEEKKHKRRNLAPGAILIGVGFSSIRFTNQAKFGHDKLQGQGVKKDVSKEGHHHSGDHRVAIHTWVARLAIGLEDHASQHEAARNAHHPLTPPVYHLVRIVAALNGAQDTVMVKKVDVNMRSCQANEHLDVEASWEEEDQDGNHHIQHEVGVAGQVKDQRPQQTLGHESLHGWLSADDCEHHLVGRIDCGNWLNQEGDKESGWECVGIEVVGQGALHRVGLKAIGKVLEVLKQSPIIGLHAQANLKLRSSRPTVHMFKTLGMHTIDEDVWYTRSVMSCKQRDSVAQGGLPYTAAHLVPSDVDAVGHHVGSNQIQGNVEDTRKAIEEHVAHLSMG